MVKCTGDVKHWLVTGRESGCNNKTHKEIELQEKEILRQNVCSRFHIQVEENGDSSTRYTCSLVGVTK